MAGTHHLSPKIGIFAFTILLFWGCSSGNSDKSSQSSVEEQSSQDYTPSSYHTPATTEPATTVVEQSQSATEKVDEQPSKPVKPYIPQKVTLSKEYEEGYDKGYDDGEDDAVSGEGWGSQFDDSNRYKGKKKKDYELGYEEGYEAGYDDNMSDDE